MSNSSSMSCWALLDDPEDNLDEAPRVEPHAPQHQHFLFY